jgi:hypothetical protein
MTLKITLTIDQEDEQGTVLIGLLAKALGRGEAGVSNLRIEREGENDLPERAARLAREGLALRAVKQSTSAKMVAKREVAPAAPWKRHAPKPGTGAFLALQIVASGAINPNAALREAFVKRGLSGDGAGATLSKLQTRGYARNVGKGAWKLTAKGEAALKERNEKVEHDDSQND